MNTNIYEKISEWLSNCPQMGSYIYFNVIPLDENTSSVNPTSSSMQIKKFIDGSQEVRLVFNIDLIQAYDDGGTSSLNLDAMQAFTDIVNYIEEKNNLHEFPDLGENYTVNEMGATYTVPVVYLTPDNPGIARYSGQFYINYLERK